MIWNRLIYIAIVIYMLDVVLMYVEKTPIQILGAVLLLTVFSGISMLIQKHRIVYRAEAALDCMTEVGSEQKLKVMIQNNSFLPVFGMSFILTAEDESGNRLFRKRVFVSTTIPAKHKVEAELPFVVSVCGRMCIRLMYGEVYDFMKIFRSGIKSEYAYEYVISPRMYETNVSVSMMTRQMPVDSDIFDPDHPGDDPSEVYQIRDFQPGDKMSQVHWKMSARMQDEIMVKDFSLPLGSNVILLADMYTKNKSDEAEINTAILESTLSLSVALMEQECPHQILWCGRQGNIERRLVLKEEDIAETIAEVMYGCGCGEEERRQFAKHVMSGYRQEFISMVLISGRENAYSEWEMEHIMGNHVLLAVSAGTVKEEQSGKGQNVYPVGTENTKVCVEALKLVL